MVVITATLLRDVLRRILVVASIVVVSVVMMTMFHLALMHVVECRMDIADVRIAMASERNNVAGRHH